MIASKSTGVCLALSAIMIVCSGARPAAVHAQDPRPVAQAPAAHAHHHAPAHIEWPQHPEPRPGITAAHILAADKLPRRRLMKEEGDVLSIELPGIPTVYQMAREIPHILDGIYCWCHCHENDHHRSLLTCFEENEMSVRCPKCQSETLIAYKLHQRGATLDQIRAVVDLLYGAKVDVGPMIAAL